MEYLIVTAAVVTLVLLVNGTMERTVARQALPVLLAAFALRLLVHVLVIRAGVIEYGGDNLNYESRAADIVTYWQLHGFQFVTADDLSYLYSVAVPCNVFALVMYLCGGPAPLACTAVVALLACTLCIVIYKFARLVGADARASFRLLVLIAFMPAFVLHTSDTFKDGFNALLVVACVGLGASLTRRFRVSRMIMAIPLLWCLWYVRPYMVFMCVVPLIFAAVVAKSNFSVGKLLCLAGGLACAMLFVGGVYDSTPLDQMQQQLDRGQSATVRNYNAEGASGVAFDDSGDAWGAFGPKVLYTLLAPFPWSPGSLTLQLGKIDVVVWYLILYAAVRGAARLWRHDRRMLLLLLLFIVPGTIAYATTMSNIGLIFRQRIPIVLITSLLAAVAWSRIPRTPAVPAEPDPEKVHLG
ncbi:hypothetical protein [Nonomuraea sp. NPDC049695]|uniref:hypothetical protein n=1 Tax=Nonomuraea sp. NPDC049695 TaxID=3154734 RepID=UPI00343E171A